jgi:glycosyltransferase involved in cell wall biosynthesis
LMRILLANSERGFRGGEFQTAALAVGLLDREMDVCVAVARDSRLDSELTGKVPVQRFGFETIPLSTPFMLRRLLREFKPQLIHAQTSTAHTHAWIASRLLRDAPPLVVSRRVAFSTSGGPLGKLKYGPGVAHYIPISRAAAVSLLSSGVPEERMTIVPSGVDVDLFGHADGDGTLRDLWGVRPGTSIIGTIAALEREKGLEVLIEAARIVIQHRRDCTFVILGEGKDWKRLGDLIEKAGLAGKVILARDEVRIDKALPLFDLFVLPSLEEGLSTSLIAALACGRPVIASRTGGIPEVVDDECAILVPPGDAELLAEAIAELLDDTLRRESFGLAGRRKAADFGIELMIERTIEVYRYVMERSISSTTIASPGG